MSEFTCKNCGKKISVPDSHTDIKGTCPNCKVQLDTTGARSVYNLTLLDIPQLQDNQEDTSQIKGTEGLMTKETDTAQKRKQPWLIDIFLYPANRSGLVILGAIIAIRWFSIIVVRSLGLSTPSLSPMVVIVVPLLCLSIFIRILLYLFFFWYLCECIRDSAEGGTRAPETMGKTPGLGEMLWLLRSLLCIFLFVGPVVAYYLSVQHTDTLFWILFVVGILFLPMSFLAFVMFDSLTSGINPILLVGSICSTFLPYCAMVLIFLTVGLLVINTLQCIDFTLFQKFIIHCVVMYLLMVTAHLLGWFYHHYQERLNWDV